MVPVRPSPMLRRNQTGHWWCDTTGRETSATREFVYALELGDVTQGDVCYSMMERTLCRPAGAVDLR
jgi:hypothetical protein